MKTIEKTVYKFSELDDAAKEKARDWYRQGNLEYDWWDGVYNDCAEVFKIIGIQSERIGKTMDGKWASFGPKIYFSGFWSQGDGAKFIGSYRYAKGAAKAIRAHAPEDKELHRIADELTAIQRKNFYALSADIASGSGNYNHEYCTSIDVTDRRSNPSDTTRENEDTITELMRDLMRWIYRQLEAEHNYLNSDEAIDESLEANEYDFEANGKHYF